MANKYFHDEFIKEVREYLADDSDRKYDFLRGKACGLLYGDVLTIGEFSLWLEFMSMKRYGRHSHMFMMEMFQFNK